MAERRGKPVRMPATKLAHLQKQMQKAKSTQPTQRKRGRKQP